MREKRKLDLLMLGLSIIIIFFFPNAGLLSKSLLGFFLLILNLLLLIKTRKNKALFFFSFAIFYFNYSFVISRYVGTPSRMLSNIYLNIYDETMITAISVQILFFAVLNFILGDGVKENNFIEFDLNQHFRYRKILVFAFEFFLIGILYYHLSSKIVTSTTILEYSLILFIFVLYFTKNNKMERIFAEIILFAFCVYSIRNGDRIAILQLLIADFIINYIKKISVKQIIIFTITGIFAFTFFGIYGDLIDTNKSTSTLNFKYTMSTLNDRRFAIDTSVAAYHAGATIIESRKYYTTEDRLKNAVTYFTKYLFLGGSHSGYTPLNVEVKKYRYNLGGGYLTSYFYFWGGWLGVILIATIVAVILRAISRKDSLFFRLYGIFILSSFPRWYMYAPDILFRGTLLFLIIYLFVSVFLVKRKTI